MNLYRASKPKKQDTWTLVNLRIEILQELKDKGIRLVKMKAFRMLVEKEFGADQQLRLHRDIYHLTSRMLRRSIQLLYGIKQNPIPLRLYMW